ncbi:hypothetical protein E3P77_01239 [Wallemia ichthyophaga]|nr:hypothetical protein E3P77_01239 [Wallemia ichthyophaga]
MTTHKFNQVDVFTDEPYRGNALAVVSLTAGTATDDGAMQRFANWTNLSETTFLAPSNKADYSVRIFTPACELPFAGHPTLGTAHVYLNSLSPEQRRAVAERGGSLTQECAAGVLQLRWDARSDVISFQAPPLNRFADVQAELLDRVCRGVSISRDDIVDAKWIDNGPPWFALRLHNADIVLDAKLSDRGAIDGLYFGIFGEHTAGHSQATFEVRGFAYDVGEDPVTGSLNRRFLLLINHIIQPIMSQMQKELAAKWSKLSEDIDAQQDETDEAADGLGVLGGRNTTRTTPNQYTPLSGQGYFSEALQVETTPGCVFRVYYTPPQHDSPVFVFHQGAGYAGLSFACLAKELWRLSGGRVGTLAFDARAHGKTSIKEGDESDEYDLSLDTLTNDLTSILERVFTGSHKNKFILAGHSMGGSVCAHAVAPVSERIGEVIGLCILDAVEGTAIEALPAMAGILKGNPASFSSLSDAIVWHIHHKIIRNTESARLSVPSMVVEREGKWIWRTDLLKTEPFWLNWFKGLSNKFIAAKPSKLLVLAGADKLDTPLMIAQMQGKFQLNVIQNVGHCLQEDDPARVAQVLYAFYERNFGQSIDLSKIKKVGQV